MNCRVYLIRHGETAWNAEMRFQGHTNIKLSTQGRNQARALGKRLQEINFGAIYASDLDRAYETATIVAGYHNLKVKKEANFKEMNFGDWEGLTFNQIHARYQESAARWWKKPFSTRTPRGESLGDLKERCMNALFDACVQYKNQNIMIVTHGGVVRTIISTILGMDLNEYWRLKQNNIALNILHFPQWENGVLELFNDCSHLRDI